MGGWGKRFYRFIFFFSYFGPAVRSLKKFQGEAQAGGQKGRGLGGRNFCPPERKSFLLCRAKRGCQNSQFGFSSKKVRILTKRHRIYIKNPLKAGF